MSLIGQLREELTAEFKAMLPLIVREEVRKELDRRGIPLTTTVASNPPIVHIGGQTTGGVTVTDPSGKGRGGKAPQVGGEKKPQVPPRKNEPDGDF